ncbi:MAG TPA: hypothetical protein PKI32_08675 [Opitutales bacterium]|nr:hypothetical protein [Opitutales bacterium]
MIVVGHRYNASELAFYLPGQPRVYHWPSADGAIDSQYELWGGLDKLAGGEVTIVSEGVDNELPASLRAELGWSSPVGVVKVEVGNGRSIQAEMYRAMYIGKGTSAQ